MKIWKFLKREEYIDRARDVFQASAQRFTDYYRTYAQTHTRDFSALSREIRNIFSAIDLCVDLELQSDIVTIVQAIDEFLNEKGYWDELVVAYNVAIEAADEYFWIRAREDDPEPEVWHNRIVLRSHLSALRFRRGEYPKARRLAKEALRQSRRIGHQALEASILSLLGNVAVVQSQFKKAEKFYTQRFAILEQLGDKKGVARTLHLQTMLASNQGDTDRAWQLASKRISVARQLGDQEELGDALRELGDLAIERNEAVSAKKLYRESLDIYQRLGDQSETEYLSNQLLRLSGARVNRTETRNSKLELLAVARSRGDMTSMLSLLQDLANLELDRDNIQDAQGLYKEALQVAEELGDQIGEALCLQGLGNAYRAKGQLELAKELYFQSLSIAQSAGHLRLGNALLSLLAITAREQGLYKQARQYLRRCLRTEHRLDGELSTAGTIHELGNIAYLEGKLTRAKRNYEHALRIYQRFEDEPGIGYSLGSLSALAFDTENYTEAWMLLKQAIDIGQKHNEQELLRTGIRKLRAFMDLPEYEAQANDLLMTLRNDLDWFDFEPWQPHRSKPNKSWENDQYPARIWKQSQFASENALHGTHRNKYIPSLLGNGENDG